MKEWIMLLICLVTMHDIIQHLLLVYEVKFCIVADILIVAPKMLEHFNKHLFSAYI